MAGKYLSQVYFILRVTGKILGGHNGFESNLTVPVSRLETLTGTISVKSTLKVASKVNGVAKG